MKLLTIAIPCYNSAAYMRNCIESLLPGGEEVEIIIVNDGSKDETKEIADEYALRYPTIVKAIHKENGGHGSAVNMGMEHATGLYFKVVDSDDWVKESAYLEILKTLKELTGARESLDMLVSNFVYDKEGESRKKVMSYGRALPENRLFTWDEIGHFTKGKYILMHSVIFRTKLLRECNLQLPEHTFYVDNIYVYFPLIHVKNLYYLNVNFYHYYIGRADQSVNEKVMISRIDQQIRVNKMMIDFLSENYAKLSKSKKLKHYMLNYLDIITTVSSIMLIRSEIEENFQKKQELWVYLKQKNKAIYKRLRYGILGSSMNLPGKGGRKISEEGYKICRKFFKFN